MCDLRVTAHGEEIDDGVGWGRGVRQTVEEACYWLLAKNVLLDVLRSRVAVSRDVYQRFRDTFEQTVLQPRRVDGRPVAVGPAHSVAGDVYSRPQAPPRAITQPPTNPILSIGHFKAVTLRSHYPIRHP